jgi:hypothetical protein
MAVSVKTVMNKNLNIGLKRNWEILDQMKRMRNGRRGRRIRKVKCNVT